MRRMIIATGLMLLATGQVAAVSVWELSRLCGKDTDAYCKGVGYGDQMTQSIVGHYEKLSPECKPIVDRIRSGEGVSLF